MTDPLHPGDRVHPIEAESYRILAERVDLSGWAPGPAAVAARVVHATADPSLLANLVVDEQAVVAGVAALAAGAPVVCDVEMVRAGIASSADAVCALGQATEAAEGAEATDAAEHPSRTAAGMAAALDRHPVGAVVVVGCAPTALAEVCRRLDDGSIRPALVVGVPVGYVGAAEAKEALVAAAARAGVPAVTLRGERGGAAVAAAVVNALGRLAGPSGGRARRETGSATGPACLLIGHGTRSAPGVAELRGFVAGMAAARPEVDTAAGYIEFVEPGLDEAIDGLVAGGAGHVVGLPLVLLGAGHLKDDGPAAFTRARARHPGVRFSYARDLGVHPDVLAVVTERAVAAAARLPGGEADAVVVVGRGSSDPDANADLAKAARLLADGRHLGAPIPGGPAAAPALGTVVPAFVSLARPDVTTALERAVRLGARRIAVVPYFLFTGRLVDRIEDEVAGWAATHPDHAVVTGAHMGADRRLVSLAWHRYDEAAGGPVHMNCDGCLYRAPLPGYEHRVAAPPFGGPPSTMAAGSG